MRILLALLIVATFYLDVNCSSEHEGVEVDSHDHAVDISKEKVHRHGAGKIDSKGFHTFGDSVDTSTGGSHGDGKHKKKRSAVEATSNAENKTSSTESIDKADSTSGEQGDSTSGEQGDSTSGEQGDSTSGEQGDRETEAIEDTTSTKDDAEKGKLSGSGDE